MKILTKSPLIEAVCEIVFMPSAVSDTTLPGILYTELKNEFPVKKDKPGNLISAPNLNDEKAIDLMAVQVSQFFSSDGKKVVQIGKDMLVNNMLAPYKGWEVFKNQILKVLKIYYENFSEKPQIRRITLKYVNVMVFNLNEDYKNIFSFQLPNPPDPKYNQNRAFNTIVEYDTEHGDILSLSFKSIFPPDNTKKSVNIELNNHQMKPSIIELDNIEKWLDRSHKSIEDLFIASFKKAFFHKLK